EEEIASEWRPIAEIALRQVVEVACGKLAPGVIEGDLSELAVAERKDFVLEDVVDARVGEQPPQTTGPLVLLKDVAARREQGIARDRRGSEVEERMRIEIHAGASDRDRSADAVALQPSLRARRAHAEQGCAFAEKTHQAHDAVMHVAGRKGIVGDA